MVDDQPQAGMAGSNRLEETDAGKSDDGDRDAETFGLPQERIEGSVSEETVVRRVYGVLYEREPNARHARVVEPVIQLGKHGRVGRLIPAHPLEALRVAGRHFEAVGRA